MKHSLVGYAATRKVFLDGVELDPGHSQKIMNLSPAGFSWGYSGEGPSQLAFAIMLAITGRAERYRDLREVVISQLPKNEDFNITFILDFEDERRQRPRGPRIVPGVGGWHILDEDGKSLGKVSRCKGSDRLIVVLRGTVGEIRRTLGTGIIHEHFTKLV